MVDPKTIPNLSESSRLILSTEVIQTLQTDINAEVIVDEDGTKGLARIELKFHKKPVVGECKITPAEGIELITDFRVECRAFDTTANPLHYTLFQGAMIVKRSASPDFNVSLYNIDERCSIQVEDQLGSKNAIDIMVLVKPYPYPMSNALDIADLINQTKQVINYGDFYKTWLMLKISANAIITLSDGIDKNTLAESVLDQIFTIDQVQLHFTRLTIQSVLPLVDVPPTSSAIALKLSKIIRKTCEAMLNSYLEAPLHVDENIVFGNINDTLVIVDRIIKPCDTIPYISNLQVPIPIEYPFTEDYPEYEEFDPEVFVTLKNMLDASKNLQATFEYLSELYSHMLQPEESNPAIQNEGMRFINMAQDAGPISLDDNNTSIVVESPPMIPMSVSAAIFGNNPYWWYPEAIKPTEDVIMLFVTDKPIHSNAIVRKNNDQYHAIHIFTKIQPVDEKIINGMVAPRDDMPIYQMQIPAKALLSITFKSICSKLRVHLKAYSRPKHYELVKQHVTISNVSNQLRYTNNGSSVVKLFIAITPDDPSSVNDVCDFSFVTSMHVCRTWQKSAWSSTNCVLGMNTTEDKLHCICKSRQFVFTAQMYMAPNHLDLPRDLFLSLHNNQVLIGFVVCLTLVFAVLMFCAWRQDRLDVRRYSIRYLHIHNQTHANHHYQITVSTGLQKNASTTSHVFLSIHGIRWSCTKLRLDSPHRFRRGTEDNFMIHTDQSFGDITSIDIWIECNGREPSWFCDWIRVRDIHQKEDWIFLVGQWFSTVIGVNPRTRHTVQLIAEPDFYSKTNLFKLHFRHLLTDRFMWYSIWMPFPRSPFTRKQRVLVAMASLTTSMMTNIMFFGQTTKENIEDENDKYTKLVMALRMVSIIGQSMLISLVLGFALTLLFKWTRTEGKQINYRLMFRE